MEDDEDTKALKAKQQADAKAMKEAREKGELLILVIPVGYALMLLQLSKVHTTVISQQPKLTWVSTSGGPLGQGSAGIKKSVLINV